MKSKLFAIAAAMLLLGAPLTGTAVAQETTGNDAGNDALSVGVSQGGDGDVTVSVTRNESGVANASVLVEATDGNYSGTGDYLTDDEGLVELPAPEENVTVDVTAEADNETATTTADLFAVEENETENATDGPFGLRVSAFVGELLSDENRTGGIGPQVAAFVTANNPGNAPDNAGPPAFVTGDNETDGDEQGPPAFVTGDNETDSGERGPPADIGPSEQGEQEDSEDEQAEGEDEEDEEDEEDNDGERGPPENAGPPEGAGPG